MLKLKKMLLVLTVAAALLVPAAPAMADDGSGPVYTDGGPAVNGYNGPSYATDGGPAVNGYNGPSSADLYEYLWSLLF